MPPPGSELASPGAANELGLAPATPASVLYRSQPGEPRGSSAFVAVMSTILVGSPMWSFALLGWAGYRAATASSAPDSVAGAVAGRLREVLGLPAALAAPSSTSKAGAHAGVGTGAGAGLSAREELAAWDTARARKHRRWGVFFLLLLLAYLPRRGAWRRFHQSRAWERLFFRHLSVSAVGPASFPARARAEPMVLAVVPHGDDDVRQ